MQLSKKTVPSLLELTAVSSYKNTPVIRHYGNMSMQKAINLKTKSVGLLSRDDTGVGAEKVRLCISNMFMGVAMYFDTTLPIEKAEVLAEEILAKFEYRQLKLEDILAICIEIKEADIYKITPARILKHVADYVKRREQLAISNSIQQSQDTKSAFGDNNIDERIKKSVRFIERTNEEVVKGRLRTRKYYK